MCGRNGLAVVLPMVLMSASLQGAEVSGSSLRVTLDEAAKGTVTHLVTADGYDFAAAKAQEPLFTLKLTRADAFTNSVTVTAAAAAACRAEPTADGVRLVYGEIGAAVEKVVCTVRAVPGDVKLRWRIAVTPKAGWMLEETHYPRLLLKPSVGEDPAKSAIVGGEAKGGVTRNPAAKAKGQTAFFGRQPGNLVAQFVSFYDDRNLFYFGSEDGLGGTKALAVERTKDGLVFNARRWGWEADGKDFGYDFVTAALSGTEAKPCSWYDAADLYKTWAVRQRWCKAPLRDRDDLPAWLRDAPVMVRFYRENFGAPELIHDWLHKYWLKEFPKMPLVAAMWGFEHRGTWVSDYFPCHPSDEAFKGIVADLRANGAHAFPWPSGYHWTLMYGLRDDGTFEYDDRAHFKAVAEPHAIWKRDGSPYDRFPSWLKGGHTSCMCGGDPWARAWWNRDVCLALARRGCEAIQADQIVGGAFPECWATNHPHAPGQGPWKVEAFREQLRTMRLTMQEAVKDAVVCFEEPCEVFNDLIGLQDYRDCNIRGEWASVFNYLYHEYVPCFQSCLYSRTPRHWYAHMAVDGQIPLFGNPRGIDTEPDALAMVNGDFERVASSGKSFTCWEDGAGAHGVDAEVKHGGRYSLRFETPAITNVRQIARNVAAGLDHLKPGRTYRLSAWLKTEKLGAATQVHYGLYRPGFARCVRHATMGFPKPEEGWVRRESTFVMPDEDSLTLRFMINCGKGENRVWIDDVRFEEVSADGAKPVRFSNRGWYHRFMLAWVKMYHGEGRDWLAHGRQVRPPRIDCERLVVEEQLRKGGKVKVTRPAVHHAAYESLDGRKALFFANATDRPQTAKYELSDGSQRTVTVAPDEIVKVER